MKKLLCLSMCLAMLFTGIGLAAQEAQQEESGKLQAARTYPFLLGIFPGWPDVTENYDVCGFKLGAPMTSGAGRVYGLEASIFYSGTETIKGVQACGAGLCHARNVEGVQASVGPAVAYRLKGLQASSGGVLLDQSMGCQASGVCVAESFAGFQTGAVDIIYRDLQGFQFGGVNIVAGNFKGCQIGGVNIVNAEKFSGCQIGVFNYSVRNGMQFGGINIIENGFVPVTILFNMSFLD